MNRYDAYRIEADPSRDRYQPILTHTVHGGEFRGSVCSCARQAVYQVTRGNTRHLVFLGAFRLVAGEMVPFDLSATCRVSGWTGAHHDFTHAMKLPKVGKS